MKKRAVLGNFEFMVLLALLRLDEAAYGVVISREIETITGHEAALGHVYATLDRLAERGLVTSRLGEPTQERGGRAKRYFSITKTGLRDVRETQRAFTKLWHAVPQLQGGEA